jgi:hypothetical protein
LQPAGGIYSALLIEGPPTSNYPKTLIATTLPSSGVVTLSQLLAQPTNVVTSFPPNGNLNMNFFTFLNMAGATMVGEPVVEGLGLAGGSMFTGSGTYPVPLNATYIVATLVGAGGGGGGGYGGANNGGGGGGSGSLIQCTLFPVNGTVTVTVGAAGGGGAVNANGTAGGNTEVSQSSGATTCIAGGGAFGVKGTSGGPGAGGTGTSTWSQNGASILNFAPVSVPAGSNGTSSAGGAGGGVGTLGGNGGAPNAAGLNGAGGFALLRAF